LTYPVWVEILPALAMRENSIFSIGESGKMQTGGIKTPQQVILLTQHGLVAGSEKPPMC
jgi:hypothetical protein